MKTLVFRLFYFFFPVSFVGRKVYFVTKSQMKNSKSVGTLAVRGYVISHDKEYYYLGDSLDEVTHGVRKNTVIQWEFLDSQVIQEEIAKVTKKPKRDSYDRLMDDLIDDKTKMN